MPSNKKSLSEEQIFADIMEMISSSNKKSKNVKNNSSKNKKNSKKNLRGGFAPLDGSDMDMSSRLASIEQQMENSPNHPGKAIGINVDAAGVQSDMGNSGGVVPGMSMSGGKPKKRKVVKKSGVKKAAKKSVAKKSGAKKVVKKVGAKKVKKVSTKKKVGAKKVKKVAKKSKRVAKK